MLILVFAGCAFAIEWTNDAGTQIWTDPGNWDSGTVPDPANTAYIDWDGPDTCIVPEPNLTNPVYCNHLYVGNNAPGGLEVRGKIVCTSEIHFSENQTSTVLMDGGIIDSGPNKNSFFGWGGSADVTLQNGAVFNASRYLIGPQGAGYCDLTMVDSTINVGVGAVFGRGGDAKITMTNSDFICNGTTFYAGENAGNFVEWDQYGGTVQGVSSMYFPNKSDGHFNFDSAAINCGNILGIGWNDASDANFIATDTVINTNRFIVANLARSYVVLNNCEVNTSNPTDGFGVEIGYSGASCEGYLVMNGGTWNISNEVRIGSGTGVPGTFEMNGGTVNCYRVKVSASGDGTFLLNDGLVDTTTFVMQVGTGGTYMNITNGVLVANGDITSDILDYIANGWLEGFSSPRGVAFEYDGAEYPGRTKLYADMDRLRYAWDPSPSYNEELAGEDNNVTLTWQAGMGAVSHDVYFGTDPDNMALIEDDTTSTSKALGDLAIGETYYWQVVEYDGTDTWEGDIWTFTILPYHSVDDFESYADETALQAAWGASAGLLSEDPPGDENYNQYMAVAYGDTVTKAFAAEDWTVKSIEALHLLVRGERANDAAGIEVTISDGVNSKTITDTDTLKAQTPWYQWVRIKLSDFTGVDLTAVTSISLKVGTAGGGTLYVDDIGIYVPVYIAEMGEDMGDVNYDAMIDNMDFAYMAEYFNFDKQTITAQTPSNTGLLVYYDFEDGTGSTVTDLSGNGYDGFVRYGTDPRTNGWTTDTPFGSYAIHFNGGHATGTVPTADQLSVSIQDDSASHNTGALSSIDGQLTVSAWVKVDPSWPADFANSTGHFFSTNDGGNKRPIDIFIPWAHTSGNPGDVLHIVGNTTWGNNEILYGEASDYTLNGWNHYAFVKDTTEGRQSIYINGVEIARRMESYMGAENAIVKTELGGWYTGIHWQMFGSVDEFRIYDRTLSQAEIVSLAGLASVEQPVISNDTDEIADPDLDGDGDSDIADTAKMLSNWLDEPVWP